MAFPVKVSYKSFGCNSILQSLPAFFLFSFDQHIYDKYREKNESTAAMSNCLPPSTIGTYEGKVKI